MRAAIINNGVKEPENIFSIVRRVGGSSVLFDYTEADRVRVSDYDLIILTGSNQFPVTEKPELLTKEIDLVMSSEIPTLGICYGCQVLAYAFGASLRDTGEENKVRNIIKITKVDEDPIFGKVEHFEVYDAHRWIIEKIPRELQILATSLHGPEVIRHKNRPLFGFQFHPEKRLEDTSGFRLFENFISYYVKQKTA